MNYHNLFRLFKKFDSSLYYVEEDDQNHKWTVNRT